MRRLSQPDSHGLEGQMPLKLPFGLEHADVAHE